MKARDAYEMLGMLPTKPKLMNTNTYGKNRFREVQDKCLQCGGKKTTNMQCDTGIYEWECPLCDEKTKHEVTELEPLQP